MATAYHNLSDYDFNSVPDASQMRFGIVVSEWNHNITGALLEGAVNTLKKHGAKDENILVYYVPGSFELTFGSSQLVKSGKVDAVIALGCVVRGDTPHFDYVANEVSKGIAHIGLEQRIPVAFGVLTCDTLEQALLRAGSKAGNKGTEAALAALEMANLLREFREGKEKDHA